MPKIVREKRMGIAHRTLHKVICDFKSYPKFLTEVSGVEVEDQWRVTFTLDLIKKFTYTLEFDVGESEISWRLLSSDFFNTNQGRWILKSVTDDETDVRYELDVDFGFLVPQWISRKLTEINLPKMLDSFEARAKKLENPWKQ